jgi:hypothetical protein
MNRTLAGLILVLCLLQISACKSTRDDYFDDGKLKLRSSYMPRSGTLDGPQYAYASTGHLRSITHYRDNKKVGRECLYYETGGLFEMNEWARPLPDDPSFRLWGNEPILVKRVRYYQNTKAFPGRSLILCTKLDEWLSQPSEIYFFVRGKPSISQTFNTANELTAEFGYSTDGTPIRQK